jgi:hypothetical protein
MNGHIEHINTLKGPARRYEFEVTHQTALRQTVLVTSPDNQYYSAQDIVISSCHTGDKAKRTL